MFYISHFFSTFFKNPLASVFWTIGVLGIITSSFFPDKIHDFVGSQRIAEEVETPYFFALMPEDLNQAYVQRKVRALPGVEGVTLLAKDKIKSHVQNILKSTKISWDKELINLDYTGLKVSLSPDLKARSQDLIRNYLSRLAGEKDVTLGAIKSPVVESKKVNSSFWQEYLILLVMGVSLLFYGLAFVIGMNDLTRSSFLTETYQRKKNVLQKSLSYSQAPILCALIVGFFYTGINSALTLGFVALIILASLFLSQRKKVW